MDRRTKRSAHLVQLFGHQLQVFSKDVGDDGQRDDRSEQDNAERHDENDQEAPVQEGGAARADTADQREHGADGHSEIEDAQSLNEIP